MKKRSWKWAIILVIIAFVIGFSIAIYLSTDDESTDSEQKDSQSKLAHIKAKIKELEKQVKSELALLKLTTEMENALARKVERISIALGAIFAALIVSVAAVLYASGFDIVTAILSTAGLVSLTFPLLSIILWRTVNFNSFVLVTRRKIRRWLDKKYGHNPHSMVVLNANIADLNGSIEKHNQELNTFLSATRDNHEKTLSL